MVEHMNKEDMDKHITKLTDELESANRKCEIYRSNLLSILKTVKDVSKILHSPVTAICKEVQALIETCI